MAGIGIVLSGGGMRGVAHLAVLDVLNELGIRPTLISGTSAGAICGAFYAKGYSSAESIKILKKKKIFRFNHLRIGTPGFYNIGVIIDLIEEHFPENTFESLPIPLTVAATDLINGEVVYFSSGNLSHAIAASACVPVVFEPVEYKRTLFVDGGVLDNFPVQPLLDKCDKIIGVHVNSMDKGKTKMRKMDVLERSFYLALNSSIEQKKNLCHVFVEPPEMTKFSMFGSSDIDEIYAYAYKYVQGMKNEIVSKLEN